MKSTQYSNAQGKRQGRGREGGREGCTPPASQALADPWVRIDGVSPTWMVHLVDDSPPELQMRELSVCGVAAKV